MKNVFVLILSFCVFSAFGQGLKPKGKTVLSTFDYRDVQLLDSKWKQQQDETKNYYLRIPNDDLLKGFRLRAGKPTHGAIDMGGWYTLDIWMPFGQILSGLSRMYATTGDVACKEKVTALINGWGECIDSNGYFFFTKDNKSQHYTYEKTLCGLIDAYQYTGNKDALKYMSIITDWGIKNLSRDKKWAGEWYTLPENLYKAYLITGDKKYYNFANEWEYTDFWSRVRGEKSVFDTAHKAYHAYSHLNTFSSASMAYMIKGDDVYKQTIKAAYAFFRDKECYPTGGFGPNEMLTPQAEIKNAFYGTDRTFETQCGSWAVFKLCKYLSTITGDGQYGDWVEKMMVNGIGASIPMSADGRVMYYSDYNPREGFKKNVEDPWSCCTGTRIQAMADFPQLIYYHSGNGLYVSQFIPSVVKWNNIKFSQTSQFPAANTVDFRVDVTGKPSGFSLNFRKASWLSGNATFTINGNPVTAGLKDNWYTINRVWHQGDKITITMPMDFSFKRVVADFEYPKMLVYGPIVMGVRAGDDSYPMALLDNAQPLKNFIPVAGEPATWHLANSNSNLLIRPFYDYEEREPYVISLDSSVKRQIGSHNITLAGNWHLFYKFTSDTGATITAKFRGTGFRLTGTSNPDAGKFSVMLDGKQMADGDEYAAAHAPYAYTLSGLKPGEHTITLTTLADRNKNSKGNIVNYGTIEKTD